MSYQSFNIRYFHHYIPIYYEGLAEEQQEEQRKVLDFKDGIYDEADMELFATYIQRKISSLDPSLVPIVLFMPSTTEKTHVERFGKLSKYLEVKLAPYTVDLMALVYVNKYIPSHKGGDKGSVDEHLAVDFKAFDEKYVFLIDDVYTTGQTYNSISEFLWYNGVTGVKGVMYARTIKKKPKSHKPINNTNYIPFDDSVIDNYVIVE